MSESSTHTHDDGTTHTHGSTDGTHDGNETAHDHNDGTHDHSETFNGDLFVPELYGSADHLAGMTAANGKPIWSAAQAAEYLFRAQAGFGDGAKMVIPTSGNINLISYGFHESQKTLADNGYIYQWTDGKYYAIASQYNAMQPFNLAQRAATHEAMTYWDDVMAPEFVHTHINDADIAFANYTNRPGTQAFAYVMQKSMTGNALVDPQVADIGGDVWVAAHAASNFYLDEGGYGMNTLVHEIGHGFGMLHPGDYNASPGVSLSYKANAEYYQDTRSYSILSYWNPRDIGARDYDFTIMNLAYGATPMVHDILAVQMRYGAEMTTRTGDTVYGFNSTADRDAFDFVKTPAPMMTIWDAGGIDTLDASGYGTKQVIDLNPGALSSIGGVTVDEFPSFEQVNLNRAGHGMPPIARATYDANRAAFMSNPEFYGRIQDNVGIAYGAWIENAVGGRGDDTMLGNKIDNVLQGNAGNDLIAAGLGNDMLDGGTGNDEMLGGDGNDVFIVGEVGDIVTELANEGTDTVRSSINYTLDANVENLVLTGDASSGTGNGLDNVITGNGLANLLSGNDGNDTLNGGDGNDTLLGGAGNDRLVGGKGIEKMTGAAGADTFAPAALDDAEVATKAGSLSIDMILDFNAGEGDRIDLSNLGQKFNFIGKADGKQAGDLSWKSFGNVNAAESVLGIDLDGIEGKGSNDPVSILFGHTNDDGIADFAIVLFNTSNVTLADLVVEPALI